MITILAEIETKYCRISGNILLLQIKTSISPLSQHRMSLFHLALREGPGRTLALPQWETKKLLWGPGSREENGLAGQGEPGWVKDIVVLSF